MSIMNGYGLKQVRALVKVHNLLRLVMAGAVGLIGGAVVHLLNVIALSMHKILFNLSNTGHLSALKSLNPAYCILIPALGGVSLWLIRYYLNPYFSKKIVDVIEANALYGGKVSVRDSLYITLQTLSSNGFGISLGLESAYTQLSAACASKIGRFFRIKQSDLRIIVGCGAAGAIGAAFNSVFGGAFYGFEIVLAAYTFVSFPFVMLAAICGVTMIGWLGGGAPVFHIASSTIHYMDYGIIGVFSLLATTVGIGVMFTATKLESCINRFKVHKMIPLVTGAMLVGIMGLVTPAVLGSGHGVIWIALAGGVGFKLACFILILKFFASSVSLGIGFRGGLFFASMLLGASAGIVFGHIMNLMGIHTLPPLVFAVIGMAVMAATIIGGPMSMMFIALDMTSSYSMIIAVLLAVIVAVVTVRKTFGYSFATWRFHIRGENIRSALDISWFKRTTVKGLMVPVHNVLKETLTIKEARSICIEDHQDVAILMNGQKQYAGMIMLKDLFASALNMDDPVKDIAVEKKQFLFSDMNITEAMDQFEQNKNVTWFAVIENKEQRQVVGVLYKTDLLQRYNDILEKQVKELTG